MNTQRMSLDVITVAEPCTESWEGMSGDDRVRYCQGCRKHVYNLSERIAPGTDPMRHLLPHVLKFISTAGPGAA